MILAREDYKVHVMTHKGKQYQVETFRSGASPSRDSNERKHIKERFVVTVPLRFRDGALLELIRVGLGRVANFVVSDLPDFSQEGEWGGEALVAPTRMMTIRSFHKKNI